MAMAAQGESDRFLARASRGYSDPARLVFHSIPSDAHSSSPRTAHSNAATTHSNAATTQFNAATARFDTTTTHFDATPGGIGNPEAIPYGEIRPSDESRAARQRIAGTNPYHWPMRENVNSDYSWPMKPATDSPVVPPRPPKPPSFPYEISIDDDTGLLPLRAVESGSLGRRRSHEDRSDNENGSVRPVASMQSMTTTVRPTIGTGVMSDNMWMTNTTIGSPPSLLELDDEDTQSTMEYSRPSSSRRIPPPASITTAAAAAATTTTTTRGRALSHDVVPSPPRLTTASVESFQTSPSILNSSIRPIAPLRPFINTHIRPLSTDGLPEETPVVEAGQPPTPYAPGFVDTSLPSSLTAFRRFPPPASQASSSPSRSPPPPYSNLSPAARRRMNSYYTMAEVRSDQIMSAHSPSPPPPPTSTRPSLRKERIQSSTSPAVALHRSSETTTSAPAAASPPLSAPVHRQQQQLETTRPLSTSSVITDDSLGTETMGSLVLLQQQRPAQPQEQQEQQQQQQQQQRPAPLSQSLDPESPLPKALHPGRRQYRPTSAASAPPEESRSMIASSSSSTSSPWLNSHNRSYSIPATMAEYDDIVVDEDNNDDGVADLGLRIIESAPAVSGGSSSNGRGGAMMRRRRGLPLDDDDGGGGGGGGAKFTDTYKEAVPFPPPPTSSLSTGMLGMGMESPDLSSLKEATFRAPLRRPGKNGVRRIQIDPIDPSITTTCRVERSPPLSSPPKTDIGGGGGRERGISDVDVDGDVDHEASIVQRPRPLRMRKQMMDTSKEIVVPSPPPPPPPPPPPHNNDINGGSNSSSSYLPIRMEVPHASSTQEQEQGPAQSPAGNHWKESVVPVRSPIDNWKETVPVSPDDDARLRVLVDGRDLYQPMSHLEMIRRKNMERKLAGRRRLRIVIA